jgi:NAD(P)-dependent dehydrogenase (short-subunit alcohol dehydrogenase family)
MSVRRVALVSGALLLGSYGLYLGKQYLGSSSSAIALVQDFENKHGSLAGKVVIITGANSGIGLGILKAIAKLMPKVFVGGRNKDKCEIAIEQVKQETGNQDVHFLEIDFSSFASVRRAADAFKSYDLPVHYLFSNAGAAIPDYVETEDGLECTIRNRILRSLQTDLLV